MIPVAYTPAPSYCDEVRAGHMLMGTQNYAAACPESEPLNVVASPAEIAVYPCSERQPNTPHGRLTLTDQHGRVLGEICVDQRGRIIVRKVAK